MHLQTGKNVYDRIDDYYGNTGESVETPTTYGGSAYISFGKDCTHIIQTLIDCGVITDVSDIQFQRPEEKHHSDETSGTLQLSLLIVK